MRFISNVRALLISLWLGAACFFSFAVAPGAFAVLSSRELAGSVVSRTLMIVNLSAIAIGLLVLLISFIKTSGVRPIWLWTDRLLSVIVVAAGAVGQFVISTWLALIRGQAGKPIEELALDDPLKIQFDQLHQYSVWVLMTAMVAALLIYILITFLEGGKAGKPASKDFDFQNEFIN